MKIAVLLCVIGVVCANQGSNTIEQIENAFVATVDVNSDGIVTEEELTLFMGVFDTNVDGTVSKHEFVTKWVNDFGDTHHEANLFFDNVDVNNNGFLDLFDLSAHSAEMDYDGDGVVTSQIELRRWFRKYHPLGGNLGPI